jgi:multimeric flavodoxin WrbA
MPNVLAIYASPRPNGYSRQLLDSALKPFAESNWQINKLDVTKLKVSFCTHCSHCYTSGNCTYADAKDWYKAIEDTDMILLASPVYFYGLPAQLKCLIDRCQPYWARRFLLNDEAFIQQPSKPCLTIHTAGAPETPRVFTASQLVLQMWCNSMGFTLHSLMNVAGTDTITDADLAKLQEDITIRATTYLNDIHMKYRKD